MKTSCGAHCSPCDRHFSGVTAFDMHRAGPPEMRYCQDPEEVDGLFPYPGDCNIRTDEPLPGTIWSTVDPDS